MIDLSALKWLKNVRRDQSWAYQLDEMVILEAKIFRLTWRNKVNASKPQKGQQMLLLQKAKVTHVVEFIDNEVYDNNRDEWNTHRIVKAVWMPPENLDWEKLPHYRDFFCYDYVVGDGLAHNLASDNGEMHQFHQHWDRQGGLKAFQNHVSNKLEKISACCVA